MTATCRPTLAAELRALDPSGRRWVDRGPGHAQVVGDRGESSQIDVVEVSPGRYDIRSSLGALTLRLTEEEFDDAEMLLYAVAGLDRAHDAYREWMAREWPVMMRMKSSDPLQRDRQGRLRVAAQPDGGWPDFKGCRR